MSFNRSCEHCRKIFETTKRAARFCCRVCARHSRINDPSKQFFAYVEVDLSTKCWNWTGHIHKTGYGVYRSESAHRFSFEQSFGAIPDGMMALHRCDNRRCVNPAHLFIGTAKDNSDDMYAKGRARPARGEDIASSKLTSAEVLAIREDALVAKEIASKYGISRTLVYLIRKKKVWAHV